MLVGRSVSRQSWYAGSVQGKAHGKKWAFIVTIQDQHWLRRHLFEIRVAWSLFPTQILLRESCEMCYGRTCRSNLPSFVN